MRATCILLLFCLIFSTNVRARDQFQWSLPKGLSLISVENRPATSSIGNAGDLLRLTSASFITRIIDTVSGRKFEPCIAGTGVGFPILRGGTEGYLLSMPRSKLVTLQETIVTIPTQWFLAATKFANTTSSVVLLDPVTLQERGLYQPRGISAQEYTRVEDDGRTVFRSQYRSGCCSNSTTCPTVIVSIDTITGTTTVVDPQFVDTNCVTIDLASSAAVRPDGRQVVFQRTIRDANGNRGYFEFWSPDSPGLDRVSTTQSITKPLTIRSILLGIGYVSLPSGNVPEVFREDGIRLSFTSDGIQGYTVSLDGQHVAYTSAPAFRSINTEVFITGIDGSNTTALTNNQVGDVVYEFTPNNERLIFGSRRESAFFLEYWMKLDGSDLKRMFPNSDYSGVHRVMAAVLAKR